MVSTITAVRHLAERQVWFPGSLGRNGAARTQFVDTNFFVVDTNFFVVDANFFVVDTNFFVVDANFFVVDTNFFVVDTNFELLILTG